MLETRKSLRDHAEGPSLQNRCKTSSGPLMMLDGTWQSKDGTLTFSRDQGAIVATYRTDGMKLIPQAESKDVTGWRWKRL